eukprot:348228_1
MAINLIEESVKAAVAAALQEQKEKQSEVVSFEFAAVADQDKKSRVKDTNKWISYLQFGRIQYDIQSNKVISIAFCKPSSLKSDDDDFKGRFDEETDAVIIETNIATKKGKGAEFSCICRHKAQNKVFIGDDKTGLVYELDDHFKLSVAGKAMQDKETGKLAYVPVKELKDDDLNQNGYKIEWMTYKSSDGLFFGSNSLESTDWKTGKVSYGNTWVAQIGTTQSEEEKSEIKTIDWTENYNNIRRGIGAVFPGWINIECIIWSEVHKSWFILPRYVSANAPFDASFACFGCRLLVIASEDWKEIKYVEIKLKKSKDDEPVSDDVKESSESDFDGAKRIGVVTSDDVEESELKDTQAKVIKSLFFNKNGAKGFSAAQFVPGTKDQVIIGVRSLETAKGISSSLCVFGIDGNVFVDEHGFKGNRKYEGLIVFENE